MFPDGTRFGGAPANFASTLASLGGERVEVHMASKVADDHLGRRAIEILKDRGIGTSTIAVGEQPTGTVIVSLDEKKHASYAFASDVAWDNIEWSSELEALAARTDAVCFGTLGQRSEVSRHTIEKFLATTPPDALRIFDVNLRPPFYSDEVIRQSLKLANVLKLNEDELPIVAKLAELKGETNNLLLGLADRHDLKAIAATRGSAGAVLYRDGDISESTGTQTKVIDTVGAGDAFTATFALGLLEGWDLDVINRNACNVAAYVCAQPGATPEMPPGILQTN